MDELKLYKEEIKRVMLDELQKFKIEHALEQKVSNDSKDKDPPITSSTSKLKPTPWSEKGRLYSERYKPTPFSQPHASPYGERPDIPTFNINDSRKVLL